MVNIRPGSRISGECCEQMFGGAVLMFRGDAASSCLCANAPVVFFPNYESLLPDEDVNMRPAYNQHLICSFVGALLLCSTNAGKL